MTPSMGRRQSASAGAAAADGWSSIKFAAFLSPEDNDPPQLGWLTTSPHRPSADTFSSRTQRSIPDHQLIPN
jgi:hypothetical protein